MTVLVPSWHDVQRLLATPQVLSTVARDKPFSAVVDGDAIVVTPASGNARRISRAEFEHVAPLIAAGQAPGDLQSETFNGSYLEAIVHFLRRRG